jgi:biopolymer transport protein ExbB
MKTFAACMALLLITGTAAAKDLRIASQKAEADYQAALAEARESKNRILEDENMLIKETARTQDRIDDLKHSISSLEKQLKELEEQSINQNRKKVDGQSDMADYTAVVRGAARDLESLLSQSHFAARFPARLDRLTPVLSKDRFPGLEEIRTISDLYLEEIAFSGEVDRYAGPYTDLDGIETTAEILTLGKFCALYRKDGAIGFLNYSPASQRFFALSKQPPVSMGWALKKYMSGKSDDVYMDFSNGAALRQLAHNPSFMDKVKKGGPIVWPILGLGLLALAIALERIVFLNRVHANTDRLMGKVNELAGLGDWQGCEEALKPEKGKPVHNVLRAGLSAVNETRETLESVLQEAILKELPRLERFLPALNIMGAVAPLLGLLGTVTGMIGTFHAITLHGAGDPRMMSGGISEALVTTMLGLTVAIPIMLIHTFLRRRLEHIVGDMEEKAVAMSNIICRECVLSAVNQKSPSRSPRRASGVVV